MAGKDVALIKIDKAKALLAEAKDLTLPAKLRAVSVGVVATLKARHDSTLEAINHGLEIQIRCERCIAEVMEEERKAGTRATGKGRPKKGSSATTLLKDGISKDQAAKYAKLAAIPEKEFEKAIAEIKESGEELSTSGVIEHNVPKPKKKMKANPNPNNRPPPKPTGKPKFRGNYQECPMCHGTGQLELVG